MSDNKVTLDQLDNSAVEAMSSSVGDVNMLNTENKTIVGAITEIVGKKEIANAIGEPLAETDKFTEMSSEINGLLSTFKTNMMNAGVVVESGDKFKALIDKIKGLTEGEGKGVQIVSGVVPAPTTSKTFTYALKTPLGETSTVSSSYVTINLQDLNFTPSLVMAYSYGETSEAISVLYNAHSTTGISTPIIRVSRVGLSSENTVGGYCVLPDSSFSNGILNMPVNHYYKYPDYEWVAIGVGEEDTTLRDSLASILENKGVDITEEDDMASLISKVDEEFNNSISVIPGEEFILETVDIGQVFSYDDLEWYKLPTWTDARYHTIRYNGSYRVTVHGTVDSNNGTWIRIKETGNNGNIIQVSDEVKIVYGTDLYNIDIQNVFKGNRLYLEIKSSSLDATISMTNYEVKMTLE